jgi:hypothetical protein
MISSRRAKSPESRIGLVDARRGSPASRPVVGDARDRHEDVANRLGARRRGDAVQSFIAASLMLRGGGSPWMRLGWLAARSVGVKVAGWRGMLAGEEGRGRLGRYLVKDERMYTYIQQ